MIQVIGTSFQNHEGRGPLLPICEPCGGIFLKNFMKKLCQMVAILYILYYIMLLYITYTTIRYKFNRQIFLLYFLYIKKKKTGKKTEREIILKGKIYLLWFGQVSMSHTVNCSILKSQSQSSVNKRCSESSRVTLLVVTTKPLVEASLAAWFSAGRGADDVDVIDSLLCGFTNFCRNE